MTFDPAAEYTLAESPEALEAQRVAEQEYTELGNKPLDLDGAKTAMGGIGTLSIEDGTDIAQTAIAQEQADEINSDNIDWGDAFGEVEVAAGVEGNAAHEIKTPLGEGVDGAEKKQEILTQEGIYSPVVDKLFHENKLTKSEANIAKEALSNDIITDVGRIPDDELSAEKKTLIINELEASIDPDKMRQYAENFATDFDGELTDFQNSDGEYETDTDKQAYEMISVRYVSPLEGEITPEQQKISLNTAFESALNIEIDGKQFDRTSEKYKQISRDIRNPDLSVPDRFQAVKDLLGFTSLEQGKGGKQQDIRFRRRTAESKLANIDRFERFEELLQRFKQAEIGATGISEIAQELEQIRTEAGITEGDARMLAGGEADIMNDSLTEDPNKSA